MKQEPIRNIVFAIGLSAVVSATALNACSQVKVPNLNQVEQTVLTDLESGKTEQQIITDVAGLIAGQPGVDAATIAYDVVTFLIDSGAVSSEKVAAAKKMQADFGMQRAAAK